VSAKSLRRKKRDSQINSLQEIISRLRR